MWTEKFKAMGSQTLGDNSWGNCEVYERVVVMNVPNTKVTEGMTEATSVTNWHFSRSFRLIFLKLTILIFQDLILSSTHTLFEPFHLLILSTIKQKCVY